MKRQESSFHHFSQVLFFRRVTFQKPPTCPSLLLKANKDLPFSYFYDIYIIEYRCPYIFDNIYYLQLSPWVPPWKKLLFYIFKISNYTYTWNFDSCIFHSTPFLNPFRLDTIRFHYAHSTFCVFFFFYISEWYWILQEIVLHHSSFFQGRIQLLLQLLQLQKYPLTWEA